MNFSGSQLRNYYVNGELQFLVIVNWKKILFRMNISTCKQTSYHHGGGMFVENRVNFNNTSDVNSQRTCKR